MAPVYVCRRLVGDALDPLSREHKGAVWPEPRPPTPDELRERLGEAEGLLCLLTERVDAAFLDAAPRLRVVSNYAVGTDNVDLEACAARGIPVGRTPDVLTDATADLTWALILAVARRIPEAAAAVRAGEWRTWEAPRWLGMGRAGRTLGIIGPGRIGQAVARRGEAFGMEVVTAGRHDDPLEVLAAADAISLHAPLTPETRGLIDARALAHVKPNAILVNTARGG